MLMRSSMIFVPHRKRTHMLLANLMEQLCACGMSLGAGGPTRVCASRPLSIASFATSIIHVYNLPFDSVIPLRCGAHDEHGVVLLPSNTLLLHNHDAFIRSAVTGQIFRDKMNSHNYYTSHCGSHIFACSLILFPFHLSSAAYHLPHSNASTSARR